MLFHPLPEGQIWVAEELKEEKAGAQGGWGGKTTEQVGFGQHWGGFSLVPNLTLSTLLL